MATRNNKRNKNSNTTDDNDSNYQTLNNNNVQREEEQGNTNGYQRHPLIREIMGETNFTYFVKSQQLHKKNQIDHKNGWQIPYSYVPIPSEKIQAAELWTAASNAYTVNNKIYSCRITAIQNQTNNIISAIEALRKTQSFKNKQNKQKEDKKQGEQKKQKNRIKQEQAKPQVFAKVNLDQINFESLDNQSITLQKIQQTTFSQRQVPQIQQEIIFQNLMKIPYLKMSFRKINNSNTVLSFKPNTDNNSRRFFEEDQINEDILQNDQFFKQVCELCQERLDEFKFNKIKKMDYKQAQQLYPLGYLSILTRKYYYIAKGIANFFPLGQLDTFQIRQLQGNLTRKRLDEDKQLMTTFTKPKKYSSTLKPETIEFLQYIRSRCPILQPLNQKILDRYLNSNQNQYNQKQQNDDIFEQIYQINRQNAVVDNNSKSKDMFFHNRVSNQYTINSVSSPSHVLISNPDQIQSYSDPISDDSMTMNAEDYNQFSKDMSVRITKNKTKSTLNKLIKSQKPRGENKIDFQSSQDLQITRDAIKSCNKILNPLREQDLIQNSNDLIKKILKCKSFQNTSFVLEQQQTKLNDFEWQQTVQKNKQLQTVHSQINQIQKIKYQSQAQKLFSDLRSLTTNFLDLDSQYEQNIKQSFSDADIEYSVSQNSESESDGDSIDSEDQDNSKQLDQQKYKVFKNMNNIYPPAWNLKTKNQNNILPSFKSCTILSNKEFILRLKKQMVNGKDQIQKGKENIGNNQILTQESDTLKIISNNYHNEQIDTNEIQVRSSHGYNFDDDNSFRQSSFTFQAPIVQNKFVERHTKNLGLSFNISVNQLATNQLTFQENDNKGFRKHLLANRLYQKIRFQAVIKDNMEDDQIKKQVETEVVQFTMIGDIKLIYYCVVKEGVSTFWQISHLLKHYNLPKGIIFTAMIHFTVQFGEMYQLIKTGDISQIVLRKNYNPNNDSQKLKLLKQHYDNLSTSEIEKIQSMKIFKKQNRIDQSKRISEQVFQKGRPGKRLNNNIQKNILQNL